MNTDLCFQNFEAELKDPLVKYGPPQGILYLAYWREQPAGCIALHPIEKGRTCEMKRLYIKPAFRKFGIGDELVKILLHEAAQLGYHKMMLDTLKHLQPAVRLYERNGFKTIPAYYVNPLNDVVYMEKDL